MLHINLRKLHVESKENLYSISVSIKHLHISPLVDSQTTRCFSRWELEMRLHEKIQCPVCFQNPQYTDLEHQKFGKHLQSSIFNF